MSRILVVANETIGGQKLLETVKDRAQDGGHEWLLVVPQNRPRHGRVIYDEAVRDAAQVRIDLAEQFMRALGIEIEGEVGDGDPFNAAMDAIAVHKPDEVIVSTHPVTQSGWLRRDLVERLRQASDLPVEHVVTDLHAEGLPFAVTLVLANQTVEGEALHEALTAKATGGDDGKPHLFIVVVPQADGSGQAAKQARERLTKTLASLRSDDVMCAGMIGDPDPYTAAMNALQFFHVSEVVVSTLPSERSGWLREHLIERLRDETPVPIEHVTQEPAEATS